MTEDETPASWPDELDQVPSAIEHVRADILELARDGAKELVQRDEEHAKRSAHERTAESQTESYGVIIRKRIDPLVGEVFVGEVIGRWAGATSEARVWSRTRDGVFAMCHRAYLEHLTKNTGMDLCKARRKAADAEFYLATIVA